MNCVICGKVIDFVTFEAKNNDPECCDLEYYQSLNPKTPHRIIILKSFKDFYVRWFLSKETVEECFHLTRSGDGLSNSDTNLPLDTPFDITEERIKKIMVFS